MITVLGASGYIGSNLLNRLVKTGIDFYAPQRGEPLNTTNLGDIIYCIGMTADFRTKPFDTVEAHVCVLNKILQESRFESLTYLSSTRVYINSTKDVAEENDSIVINPLKADELYSLTKLTGESLCLASGRNVKIVRLSNVFGNDFNSANFLAGIIKNIYDEGTFTLQLSLSSSKDYLYIEDAVSALIEIAQRGKEKIYNLAFGQNVSNEEIIDELKKYVQFSYNVADNAREVKFPIISIAHLTSEFNFNPESLSAKIATLLKKV